VIDIAGAAHLRGGEDALLKGMVARLAASAMQLGRRSPTAGAAPMLLPAMGRGQRSLSRRVLDLPIAALRLPKTMVEDLSVLGLRAHRWQGQSENGVPVQDLSRSLRRKSRKLIRASMT
jgi:protein ImuB